MRILYVAPRYHTNQVPVMHGWKAAGEEVAFWAQFCGVTEVHDAVQFHQMEQSGVSKWLYRRIEKKYPADIAETKKILAFIPKKADIVSGLKAFEPDVIIMRERTICNAVIYRLCRKMGYKNIILYIQTPIYGRAYKENPLKSKVKSFLFPQKVFSPVFYKDQIRGRKAYLGGERKHYIPLVCDKPESKRKEYCVDGIIHVLDVGKYRDYKNHDGLIESIRLVQNKNRFRITVAGQATTEPEEQYFERLQQKIEKYGLQGCVELKKNIPFNAMNQLYAANDILILPSKGESAGMVILEAMSQGLYVMSSIHCGLASVLDEYHCGFTFDINNPQEPASQLDYVSENLDIIRSMGRKSVDVIRDNFLFENYRKALIDLINSNDEGNRNRI